MEFAKTGNAVFKYNGVNISCPITNQELCLIKSIFDKKKMYMDNPSCGFSDDISVRFNDSQTVCFACDTCPIIYWKEENRYFSITEKEKMQLYNVLENYGFLFPCI